MNSKGATSKDLCLCQSGYPMAACCAPFIAGLGHAPTAEALMRSRYTAYALQKSDYLLSTWHRDTRPEQVHFDPKARWLGLKVKRVEGGQPGDTEGEVEFVARYKVHGKAERMHESSRFRFEDGRWFYVSGEFHMEL